MECIKTGATVYLSEYKTFHRADVYQFRDSKILRINAKQMPQIYPSDPIHMHVKEIEHWFDETSSAGTMFVKDAVYYGYDGVECKVFSAVLG